MALSFGRRIALALVITFGKSSEVAQLLFMNFSSILLLIFVGLVRPFASRVENILEMLNEYTILMIYCHCITQTDFVVEMAGRQAMGWSLIGLTTLNILVNFGNILVQDLWTFYRKIKLFFLKQESLKRQRLETERRLKADRYRAD